MTHAQVEEALDAVRRIQTAVLIRQRFRGYSGKVRIASGVFALVLAWIMTFAFFPKTNLAFTVGWGVLCFVTMFSHAVAIVWWYIRDARATTQSVRCMAPVLDVIPVLFFGGILTLVLLIQNRHDLLYGMWMGMFSLTIWAARHVMPPFTAYVGLFYMACGLLYLFAAHTSFLNPWPMGIVFGVGETVGGLIMCLDTTLNKGDFDDK